MGGESTARMQAARRIPVAVGRPKLAVALGNAQRELVVLAALDEWGDYDTAVCVHAADLLARVRADALDALLVSSELPGLGPALALDVSRSRPGARLILLADDPASLAAAGATFPAVLPLSASPVDIRAALAALERATRPRSRQSPVAESAPAPPQGLDTTDTAADNPFGIIAVASGAGSPGRSTIALCLAAALGAVAPTALIDADLAGPSLAALLDAEPRRNLFQVAYGQPESPQEWDEELARALQPLGPRSPHGRLLCGLPTAAMRAGVSPAFFGRAIGALAARYRHVILDLGADLLGTDTALHRIGMGLAGQVLLVTTPDLADLLRARAVLAALEGQLGIPPDRIALIVNRHDRRRHQGRRALEWALGQPLAALLPYDHAGAMRAKAARRPLVLDRRSRAGRALLELAGRIHGGAITPSPEPSRRWPARFRGQRRTVRDAPSPTLREVVHDGD